MLKLDGCPRSIVRERMKLTRKVNKTPKTAIPTTAREEMIPARCAGTSAPIKIVAKRIRVGQRPLQSAKLLVMMAISRSRAIDNTRGDHAGGVAPETHHHTECLFAVCAGFLKSIIQVEGNPRQVPEVL